jgi:hypothetical protein
VTFQIRPWQLVVLLLGVCVTVIGTIAAYRSRAVKTTASLARHLPLETGTVAFHLNVAALRSAGLLDLIAGSRAVEEDDYKSFVGETGFDYRTDLDTILAGFNGETTHLLLRGRFDWEKLHGYAQRSGGACWNGFCNLAATARERVISFFALDPDVLALAVGPGNFQAAEMAERRPVPSWIPADRPLWIIAPAARLAESPLLPTGTRSFVTAVRESGRVILTLGPSGDRLEAVMEVACRRPEDAARIASELEAATETLRRFIAREKKTANPRDLSGVLTAGSFSHQGTTVRGRWPIERVFLETVAAGGL